MTTKLALAIGLIFVSSGLLAQPPFLKTYYLSSEPVMGDSVLLQCASGYHFASIWEIYNTSALTYDTELGFTTDFSGLGPPEGEPGWIMSGSPSFANCENWTSSADAGTFAVLNFGGLLDGGGAPNPSDGWFIEHHPCGIAIRVWCVSD